MGILSFPRHESQDLLVTSPQSTQGLHMEIVPSLTASTSIGVIDMDPPTQLDEWLDGLVRLMRAGLSRPDLVCGGRRLHDDDLPSTLQRSRNHDDGNNVEGDDNVDDDEDGAR